MIFKILLMMFFMLFGPLGWILAALMATVILIDHGKPLADYLDEVDRFNKTWGSK